MHVCPVGSQIPHAQALNGHPPCFSKAHLKLSLGNYSADPFWLHLLADFWVCKQSAMCAPIIGQSDWQKLGDNLWLNCPCLWTKGGWSDGLEVTSITALFCPEFYAHVESLNFHLDVTACIKHFFFLSQDKCACISHFRKTYHTPKRCPSIAFRVKTSFLLDDSYQQSCSCLEREKRKQKTKRKK